MFAERILCYIYFHHMINSSRVYHGDFIWAFIVYGIWKHTLREDCMQVEMAKKRESFHSKCHGTHHIFAIRRDFSGLTQPRSYFSIADSQRRRFRAQRQKSSHLLRLKRTAHTGWLRTLEAISKEKPPLVWNSESKKWPLGCRLCEARRWRSGASV